jgi:hypothetical protein
MFISTYICSMWLYIWIFAYFYICLCEFFLLNHAYFFATYSAEGRMVFLPRYPSNEWRSSPVGQSEISMTGQRNMDCLSRWYTVKRPILKNSLKRQIAPLKYINTLLKRSIPKKPRYPINDLSRVMRNFMVNLKLLILSVLKIFQIGFLFW